MTHQFQTQHGRDLFALMYELTTEAHPCGQMHNFTGRPVTLPSAHMSAVQDELARLNEIHRHAYRGKPGEL